MKLQSIYYTILCFLFTACVYLIDSKNGNKNLDESENIGTDYKLDTISVRNKAIDALQFIKTKSMNQHFCILIDMKIHSGRNRFFIWDYAQDKLTHSYLVGHGCCDRPWGKDYTKDNPSFSNKENSHCSSLGKYKLGERGYSNWGVHTKYLMHGLELTNNNALKRTIVFHSWEDVSDTETFPKGTPEGWGCPTLSNTNFRIVDLKLKSSKKPVLMWIYND